MSDALARLPFPAHVTQPYHPWRCVGRDYLDKESEHKREHPFDFTGWEDVPPINVPKQVIWLVVFTLILLVSSSLILSHPQTNGFDCGVFASCFAEYRSRDAPMTFGQVCEPLRVSCSFLGKQGNRGPTTDTGPDSIRRKTCRTSASAWRTRFLPRNCSDHHARNRVNLPLYCHHHYHNHPRKGVNHPLNRQE